jgi:hypothetical protein
LHPNPVRVVQRIQRKGRSPVIHIFLVQVSAELDVARRGKDEWPIDDQTADPMAARALLSALETAQVDDLAAERTAQALPFIVAWARRDPAFPRPALAPVYGSLLTLFALGSARGRTTYESSQILVAALLSGGLDGKSYRELIADVEELASAGFGLDTIYLTLPPAVPLV